MEQSEHAVVESPRMAIGQSEPLGDALKRVALEQIEIGRDGFSLPADDAALDSRVHLARKAIKRTRALLRLLRDQIGEDEYHEVNCTIRDQARMLSELRTARVLIGTIDQIAAAEPAALHPAVVRTIRGDAVRHRAELVNRVRDDVAGVAAAVAALDRVRGRIEEWRLSDDFSELHAGLRRVYRRGRRARKMARQTGTVEAFHDWRKRVNYLRYQMEALSDRLPAEYAELEESLNALSELLGDEHDLADFAQLAAENTRPEDRNELLAKTDRDRRGLQKRALHSSKALYADKPDRFVVQVDAAWTSADPDSRT